MFEGIASEITESYGVIVEEETLEKLKEEVRGDVAEGLKKSEFPEGKLIDKKNIKYYKKYKSKIILYRFGPPPKELSSLVESVFKEQETKITDRAVDYIAWLYNSIVINSLFASAVFVKMSDRERVSIADMRKNCEKFFGKPSWFIC